MKYIVDGKNFSRTREDTYSYLREALDLPDYFGKNLDSLWDILSFREGLDIEILNARDIINKLGVYGCKVLDVFGDLDSISTNNVVIRW